MQLIKGITPTAPKLLLYGTSGVGKSTLANKLEKPIFLDIEGGLNQIDCVRTPVIQDLRVFYKWLDGLDNTNKGEFKTIVIDSADWLVRIIKEQAAGISKDNLKATLVHSNGGYGAGTEVYENYIRSELLPYLSRLNSKGYGICLIAHADKKSVMDADGSETEKITPKIDPRTMHVFVEWVDEVLYLKKDIDGSRMLVLESDNNVLAKNRLGKTGEVAVDKIDINKFLRMEEK